MFLRFLYTFFGKFIITYKISKIYMIFLSPLNFRIGCFNAALGIIMGAAGGHKKEWSQERKDIFHKALFYQFTNSVALMISSMTNSYTFVPISLFLGGTLLFSGSLYHRAFTDSQDLSKRLPPYGGIAMIIGWIFMGCVI